MLCNCVLHDDKCQTRAAFFGITVLREMRWSKIHPFCLVWMVRGTWLHFWISHHQLLNQLRDCAPHDEKCYTEEAHPLPTLIHCNQIVVCRDIIDSWLWTKYLIRGHLRGRYSYSCLHMVALIVSSMSQDGLDCTSNQMVNFIFWLKLLALKGALHQYVREFPAQGAAVASEKNDKGSMI